MSQDSLENPPSYEAAVGDIKPPLPMRRRFWEPLGMAAPLLVAIVLLYLSTGSSTAWRTELSVLKISLEDAEYRDILRMTSYAHSERSVAGWLSVSPWGWCVTSSHTESTTCSKSDMWYSMHSILTGALANAIRPTLSRALVLHFVALFATLLAAVPLSVNIYKRYYSNDAHLHAGWGQHASLLVAFALATTTWIIDVILLRSAARELGDRAQMGRAQALTGAASLLLVVCLLATGLPAVHRHFRKQQHELRRWTDVEALEKEIEAELDEPELSRSAPSRREEEKGKRYPRKHSRRWKRRHH